MKVYQVKVLFFDLNNNVICHWGDHVRSFDPASACHTAIMKARIVHGSRIGFSSRMDVSVKLVLNVHREVDLELVEDRPPYLVA